ncbi:MAG: hypothetical protein Ta2G_01570 [Termitinemataceae bacterium]|nr:MAG: hypothetical protein Ta2G_01570 [Termitinemataceae bacterium]
MNFKKIFIQGTLHFLIIAAAALVQFSCGNKPEPVVGPGQTMSFNVKINLSNKNAARYKVIRAYIMDRTSKQKIGQCIGPFGHGASEIYKVTMPESYAGETDMILAIDLEVRNSGFDNPQAFIDSVEELKNKVGSTDITVPTDMFKFLDEYPIALGLIKSRYASTKITIPTAGSEVTVNLKESTDMIEGGLVIGNGPGAYQLDQIDGLPPIYTLDIDTSSVDDYEFKLSAVLATEENPTLTAEGIPVFDELLGISAPGLDWVFVALSDTAPGDTVKLWYLFTAPEEGHACPCMKDYAKCPAIRGLKCKLEITTMVGGIPTTTTEEMSCPYEQFSNTVFITADDPPMPSESIVLPNRKGDQIYTAPVNNTEFDAIDFDYGGVTVTARCIPMP